MNAQVLVRIGVHSFRSWSAKLIILSSLSVQRSAKGKSLGPKEMIMIGMEKTKMSATTRK
jgi:hypothetical protein